MKSVHLLLPIILCISLIPSILVIGAGSDQSTVTIGNGTGFVLAGSATQIVIEAKNSSGAVPGANAEIVIVPPSGSPGIVGDGITNVSTFPALFSATNGTGHLVLTWFVPETNVDIPNVEINVTITDNVGSYQIPTQLVTITPSAVDLDSVEITLNQTTAEPEEDVLITFSAFTTDDALLSGIQIAFNATSNLGTFSVTNAITDNAGQATTVWTAPSSISAQIEITIQATAQVFSLTYIAKSNITLTPFDFSKSSVNFSSSPVETGSNTSIIVLAKGDSGVVSEADVQITQIDTIGSPYSVQGKTNSTGYAIFSYSAPLVTETTNITFSATISKAGGQGEVNATLTVVPILYQIEVAVNASTVDVNQTVEMTITVSYKGSAVNGATIEVSTAQGGRFVGTTSDTIQLSSDSEGKAIVRWIADIVPLAIVGSDVILTIQAYGIETGVAIKEQKIHVNPLPTQFTITMNTSKAVYAANEEITIIVKILNQTNMPYEGALITLETIAGMFKSSNSTSANELTNTNGTATFVWMPTGFDKLLEPLELNFTATISISEFNLLLEQFTTVTIEPLNKTTTSTIDSSVSNLIDQLLGGNISPENQPIVIGSLIGILGGLGLATFIILRRRG